MTPLPSRRAGLLRAVAVLYAVGLAVVVLAPVSRAMLGLTVGTGHVWSGSGMPGRPAVPITGAVLNVALFVPFGLLVVALGRRSWLAATVLALAVSVVFEVAQLWPVLGRDASLADVLSNTAGGLLGALVATGWCRVTRRRDRAAAVDVAAPRPAGRRSPSAP